MDCQDAKEKLLESFDGALSPDDRRRLESHLAACPECAEFNNLLHALDVGLKEAITAPRLSAGFRTGLQAKIERHSRELWLDWLPDAAYLAGSVAAIVYCVFLLPLPASVVLWIGTLIAATGYSMQALLLGSLEEI
jgi:anti-sigma factor RsiW